MVTIWSILVALYVQKSVKKSPLIDDTVPHCNDIDPTVADSREGRVT